MKWSSPHLKPSVARLSCLPHARSADARQSRSARGVSSSENNVYRVCSKYSRAVCEWEVTRASIESSWHCRVRNYYVVLGSLTIVLGCRECTCLPARCHGAAYCAKTHWRCIYLAFECRLWREPTESDGKLLLKVGYYGKRCVVTLL